MNGDLTRDTFDPRDGFTAVRAQQGRVMLDADHNEQVDIQLHDTREGRVDLVGGSGAPSDEAGFAVSLVGNQPTLGVGRYLVDGIRVRNGTALTLSAGQPFLAGNTLPAAAGAWLAYLEVWERPLTAVEEPKVREVALGGPDTTLRDQRVWQVRWLRLGDAGSATNCVAAATGLTAFAQLYDGTLEPGLDPGTASGPCIVSEAAQFRGLENQLFRVEIHAGNISGDGATVAGTPTFKWSADNGAVVASVVALASTAPILLQVDRLGPGGAAGFERGGTVEIRDEAAVLSGTPGILAQVDDVQGDALRLTLLGGATVLALQTMVGGARVVVRRWDSVGALAVGTAWTNLEGGLRVRFAAAGRYRTGDFWLIPARTALLPGTTSPLDWPLTAPGASTYQLLGTRGPARHRIALAILDRDNAGNWSFRSDCRRLFPPLTSILTLSHAGGDGQHARSRDWLPAPIAVALTRGKNPVANASVRFRIGSGGGVLSTADPSTNPPGQAEAVATTDADGRAQAFWRLGTGPARRNADVAWEPLLAQRVDVVRLGPDSLPDGAPVAFVAQTLDHFNLHVVGGNGQQGSPGELLDIALRVRVDDGQRPVERALVEFVIRNQISNGQPLNQETGGWLLANPPLQAGSQTWSGGTLHHTVRILTDADGIAQAQWTLGTHLDLTTQRVEAWLLDAAGNRTSQWGLFLADLALASEVTWRPLVPWLAALLTAPNRHVQAAIDTIAQRLDQVAAATTFFDPFLGVQWRDTANALQPLSPQSVVPVNQLAAVVLRADLVPTGRNTTALSRHAGIRVYAELPAAKDGLDSVVHLEGSVARAANGWEWRLSSQSRGALAQALAGRGSRGPTIPGRPTRPGRPTLPIRVTVVPRWLPGGLATDSSLSHEMLFEVR